MEKKKKVRLGVIFLFIIGFFIIQGLIYGWFFQPKPAVVVYLARNTTEILGFTYAKHPGSLMCIACDDFSAEVEVTHKNKIICKSSNGYIGLGYTYMPVLCENNLEEYKGKEVTIHANGSVNKQEKKDIKTLILEFKKKDELRK